MTEARAGESCERAPGARREGQCMRRGREYYRSDEVEVGEREMWDGEWVKRPAATKGFESRMKSLRVAEAPCALATGRRGRIVAGMILSSWSLSNGFQDPVECSIFGVHELIPFLVRVAGLGSVPLHLERASGL